jgi:hypothetical protein
VLDWMVGREMDGGVRLCRLVMNPKLESVVESMYCKVQICDNILNLFGGGEM